MNRKRNVCFSRPEDPAFLKELKKQAGYDDKNHKFDELPNNEEDFVDDDDSEQPQVVVLKKGDLTAEEAEAEKHKIDLKESETKADLTQRVIFKSKNKDYKAPDRDLQKRKSNLNIEELKGKKTRNLLSFEDDDELEDD